MALYSSTQIPKPSDPTAFQTYCKVLFECVLNDPNVKENGTSGQSQNGVDLYGRRKERGLDYFVGIQCKLAIKAEKLDVSTIRKEVKKALTFEPHLKEYIIVTTAEDDALLDKESRYITLEQGKLGRDFEVHVWGWKTLQDYICRYEAAFNAFHPDSLPHIRKIQKGQDRLLDLAESSTRNQQQLMQKMDSVLIATGASVGGATTLDASTFNTFIDKQIDEYRDLLVKGKSLTSLDLLQKLWKTLPEDTSGRIKYRIKANMAGCYLRQKKDGVAAECLLEAYSYAPSEPKAPAQKVLALVLQEKHSEAFEFGLSCLESAGDKGTLISNMIGAAKCVSDLEDIFKIIPAELKTDQSILISKIDYLRSKNEAEWLDLALEAERLFPQEQIIVRFAAEARLHRIFTMANESGRVTATSEDRTTLQNSLATLRKIWDEERASEHAWDNFMGSLAINIICGYRLLRQFDSAKEIIDVTLEKLPDESGILEQKLIVATETGELEKAKEILKLVPINRDSVFTSIQVNANIGAWSEVVETVDGYDLTQLSKEDACFAEALRLLSKFKLGQLVEPRKEAEKLLERFEDVPVSYIILHQIAYEIKDTAWAASLYERVKAVDDLTLSARFMLARIAEEYDDYSFIIKLLNEHLETDEDTQELRLLTRAFVNTRYRKSTKDFLARLSKQFRGETFYERAAASIYYNAGELSIAERSFISVLKKTPEDAACQVGLIHTYLRQDKKEEARQHLASLDPEILKGSSYHKLGIAQMLATFGREYDGIKYAYKIAIQSRDDSKTLLLYMGLLLPSPTTVRIPSVGGEIEVNCEVELQADDGKEMKVVIEEGKDRPSINHYSPNHALSKALIGKKKGEEIVVEGAEQRWKVQNFKHKYLGLLHEIMQSFNTQFPDVQGFRLLSIKGDDPSPLLEQVRSGADYYRQAYAQYTENNFPLSFASGTIQKPVCEFAANITSSGKIIRVCTGVPQERKKAITLAQTARSKGIVFDTYTAWIAHKLKLLPTFKEKYGRIAIARSSLDELYEWRSNYEKIDPDGLTKFGYVDGQYVRYKISADELKDYHDSIDAAITEISLFLEVLPVVQPRDLEEAEERILQVAGRYFFDPIYLSIEHDLVLVSDDMYYRSLSAEAFQIEGVWIQSLLIELLESKSVDFSWYSAETAMLCRIGHGFTTLGAKVLSEILIQNQDDIDAFEKVAHSLCSEGAEVQSHFDVIGAFLKGLFELPVPRHIQSKAATIMLGRLLSMGTRHEINGKMFLSLLRSYDRETAMKDFIGTWVLGNFIVMSDDVLARSAKRKRKKGRT